MTTNFVQPGQAPAEPPKWELIRRQDVIDANAKLIDAYSQQQSGLLAQLQTETTSGGFLSGPEGILERRKTSAMYLRHYSFVTALAVGGIVLLAWANGMVADVSALATWICGTGVISLLLAWRRHGDEFAHSPEGLAHSLLDWHGSVAQYESETRRIVALAGFEEERRRLEAAEAERNHARASAQLRIAELDAQRRRMESANESRFAAYAPVASVAPDSMRQQGRQFVIEAEPENLTCDVDPAHVDDKMAGSVTTSDNSLSGLVISWLIGLYGGKMTESGLIRTQAPWAVRSPWNEADKKLAERALCDCRPAVIERIAGGRLRLRRELFTTPEQAATIAAEHISKLLQ